MPLPYALRTAEEDYVLEIDASIAALRLDSSVTGVFLDFDGTLSPMILDPTAAQIVVGAPEVLEGLAQRYALVALISGRGAQDLKNRVAVDGLRYFGLYGAEEMTGAGLEQALLASRWRKEAQILATAAACLIEEQNLIGCEVEYKDLAVSVHYRKTGEPVPPPDLYEWALRATAQAGFTAGIGRKVIELRPESVSKAGTFRRLAAEHQIENALVAGDDSADVEMMHAASQVLSGTVLRVGVASAEEPPGMQEQADVQVGSPAELMVLLSRLL